MGESEASEPAVLDLMSFPFNISITVITHTLTHTHLYKTHVIVVANLLLCPQEINFVMLTFGVIKINRQLG